MATLKPLPDPGLPWINPETGSPNPPFAEYLQSVARLLVLLNANTLGSPLTDAANDAAAAAAGVPINSMYRTGNAVQIRLT